MTATEKRYFKLYTSKYSKSKRYQQMFDIINSMKNYDEKEVIKRLKSNMTKNKFQFEKNYLYNTILKSLNEFHTEISIESKIDELNKNIEVLSQKGLYDQALKLVRKAVKLGDKYQCCVPIVRTYDLELKLYEKRQKHDLIFKTRDKIKGLYNKLSVTEHFKELAALVSYKNVLYRTSLNEEHLKDMKKAIWSKLEHVDEDVLPFEPKMHVYFTKARYYEITGEIEKSMNYFKKMIQLYEEYPAIIQLDPEDYLISFGNYALCKLHLRRYKELLSNIEHIKKLKDALKIPKTDYHDAYFFFFTRPYALSIYNKIGDMDHIIALSDEVEYNFEKYERYVPKTVIFNTTKSLSMSYFLRGEYRKSLKLMNVIMQDELGKYSRGYIFYLIIHLELGNDVILNSLMNSTKRLLTNQGRFLEIDNLAIEMIKELIKEKQTPQTIYQKYYEKMKALPTDPATDATLDYFNVIKWAESKIKQVDFVNVLGSQPQHK